MSTNSSKIIVGRFGSPFGIKGWIKLQSFTEPEENLLNYKRWYWLNRENWVSIEQDDYTRHGKGWIVHLVGYDSPEAVRFLAGVDVAIERQDFPPLAEGEFYLHDVLGFRVQNLQGIELGQVTGFMDSGAHELLVVSGMKEYLIPLIRDHFLISVDTEKRQLVVDWDAD